MDETSCNHLNEAYEKECKLADNSLDKNLNSDSNRYKRDFLLKLRLHPLSLEKPNHLPKVEIIKDKLNLDNINEASYDVDEKFGDGNNFYSPIKVDYSNIKPDYPIAPSYYNRMFPYGYPPHVCGGSYLNAAPKFRMAPQMYFNSLKKPHSCYKDFAAEECFIPKRCYPPHEDIWTCYPPSDSISFPVKKNEFEAVSKGRKKLSIIDPATGKNILESVTNNENGTNSTVQANGGESDIYSESSGHAYDDDYYYYRESAKPDVPESEVSSNIGLNPPKDAVVEKENVPQNEADLPSEKHDTTVNGEVQYERQPSEALEKDADCLFKNLNKTPVDKSSDQLSEPSVLENDVQMFADDEITSKEQTEESYSPQECPIPPPTLPKSDDGSYERKENVPQQCDCTKEKFKQLKEKIHSIKQEQQKMAIMQSFLHYKKYQLEECARNLDEKRIELANLEWNLYNKAKVLQEREQWLQQKTEKLYEKAIKLAHKEKMLSDQEDMKSSDSWKSSSFRSIFDDGHDFTWENSTNRNKSSKPKGTGGNESQFTGQSSKLSPGHSASDCTNSVISSLDQLERNIVTIEKIHGGKEDGFANAKSESYQTHSTPLKNENVSEPIGYSKGRRYMPEHLKYWMNKRDKNSK